ncbi:hypothetical protein HPB52_018665 [Rhipicephalus sanguineus]|uniref:Uncharacterized protein n=1 Tax=Rhipicephalus sanguineus TaxID=34632 RepID=A0A9D4PP80_RHISA|nr:hypothetical protein HPB52_018665 [Rhipicephalus sanguineus]
MVPSWRRISEQEEVVEKSKTRRCSSLSCLGWTHVADQVCGYPLFVAWVLGATGVGVFRCSRAVSWVATVLGDVPDQPSAVSPSRRTPGPSVTASCGTTCRECVSVPSLRR